MKGDGYLLSGNYQVLYFEYCVSKGKIEDLIKYGTVSGVRGFWIDEKTFSIVYHDKNGIKKLFEYPLRENMKKASLESGYDLIKPASLAIKEVPDKQKILELCSYALIRLFSFVIVKDNVDIVDEIRQNIKLYTGWNLKVLPLERKAILIK